MSTTQPFGKLRAFLWPVYFRELSKLLPMLAISFLLSFNYNILKSTKDSIVVTSSSKGVESIPFIKIALILPLSILFVYLFTKISDRLDREKRLYAMTAIFVAYFALFTFVIYPFREQLYLSHLGDYLEEKLHHGHGGLIDAIRYWPYTTFYAISELWGAIILNVGFWSFVNEITRVEEAKRFYPIMTICLNISGIASGYLGNYFIDVPKGILHLSDQSHWDRSLVLIMSAVIITAALAMGLFYHLNRVILRDADIGVHAPLPIKGQRGELQTSFIEDVRLLLRSPYILAIATTVFAFGFIIGATELLWKDQVRHWYPTTAKFYEFSNKINILTGFLATALAFLTGWSIRQFGWSVTALLSPILVGITSLGFFGFLLFPDSLAAVSSCLLSSPDRLAIQFGIALTALSRTLKYTFFDATKELAFIPLDRKTKLQGKAAIDGVGSRLGKSSASVLYTILFSVPSLGSLAASKPYIFLTCIMALAMWLAAVVYLGGQFQQLASRKNT